MSSSAIDQALIGQHLRHDLQIAGAHGIHCADHLTLDQASHGRERAAHGLDVGIELAVGVVSHGEGVRMMRWMRKLARAVSRNGP